MNFFTFYFIGVGVIFLTKLIFNLISFKNLKRYMNENKKRIDFLLREEQIDYTDLIIYHFATNVYEYTKYKNELENNINKEGTLSLVITFFVCVFWPLALPTIWVCWLYNKVLMLFERFSKYILTKK
jgi:hypothetical protein